MLGEWQSDVPPTLARCLVSASPQLAQNSQHKQGKVRRSSFSEHIHICTSAWMSSFKISSSSRAPCFAYCF